MDKSEEEGVSGQVHHWNQRLPVGLECIVPVLSLRISGCRQCRLWGNLMRFRIQPCSCWVQGLPTPTSRLKAVKPQTLNPKPLKATLHHSEGSAEALVLETQQQLTLEACGPFIHTATMSAGLGCLD